MAMNKIQFQPGMSFSDFACDFGTEEKCAEALEKARWPQGFICPTCQNKEHYVVWHNKVKTFQCVNCHTQTTLTSGTIFHSTKLPLMKWFQAFHILTQTKNNVAALELRRLLGIGYSTASRMKHKILQVMFEREASTILSGRVELDDAYMGGEHPGGKAGRGSENKVPFVAAIQTSMEGHPLYAIFSPVKSFSSEEIAKWACCNLAPSATVVTDGYSCFRAVTKAGCTHEPHIVGKKRKSTDMGCFNWVNTVLGNIKNAISGTYHNVKYAKYLHRYLAEAQYRFNRRFDLRSMMPRLLYAAVNTGKRTEAWLRLDENAI